MSMALKIDSEETADNDLLKSIEKMSLYTDVRYYFIYVQLIE